MGDQKSSGNAKGDQTPQLASKQCSFEPTSVPQKGINARSYSSGKATAISRLQLILLRDPGLAIVDPVGTAVRRSLV